MRLTLNDILGKIPLFGRWVILRRTEWLGLQDTIHKVRREASEASAQQFSAEAKLKEFRDAESYRNARVGTLGTEPFCGCCNKFVTHQKFGTTSFMCKICMRYQVVFLGGLTVEEQERMKKLVRSVWEKDERISYLEKAKCDLEYGIGVQTESEKIRGLERRIADLQGEVASLRAGAREPRPARVERSLDL